MNSKYSLSIDKIEFSKLTGQSVKIAVVDSGCDFDKYKNHNVIHGVKFMLDSRGNIQSELDGHNEIGHGTACIGIILKKAPDVIVYPIRIFSTELVSKTKVLVEAIKHAIEQNVKIINLSLGTTTSNFVHVLNDICQKAYQNNIVTIDAKDNENLNSFLAFLPNVVGVTAGKVYQK